MDSCNQSDRVFDLFRKKSVRKGKEEEVRQALLLKMIRDLGYPKDLIAVEKELKELTSLEAPKRRIDIVCFRKQKDHLQPLLLIECKHELFGKEPLAQVMGYNAYVKAPFIAVVGKKQEAFQVLFGAWQAKEQHYQFYGRLPPYQELL